MNQFKDYKKFKKYPQLWKVVNDFDYILNNIWCNYSFEKGLKRWIEIDKDIPDFYSNKIYIEISHVRLNHDKKQSLMAVKEEMRKYLDYLIENLKEDEK